MRRVIPRQVPLWILLVVTAIFAIAFWYWSEVNRAAAIQRQRSAAMRLQQAQESQRYATIREQNAARQRQAKAIETQQVIPRDKLLKIGGHYIDATRIIRVDEDGPRSLVVVFEGTDNDLHLTDAEADEMRRWLKNVAFIPFPIPENEASDVQPLQD